MMVKTVLRSQRFTKYDRIEMLKYFGLNTQISILVQSQEDVEKNHEFLKNYSQYSVRTFYNFNTFATTPFFPIINKEEFFNIYWHLLENNLSLIVSEPIDNKDALLAGVIMRESIQTTIEVARGPVTVREVTHRGRIDDRYVCYGFLPHTPDPMVNAALIQLYWFDRSTSSPIEKCMFEFSYYSFPIGWKHNPVIFWEITSVDDGDLDIVY